MKTTTQKFMTMNLVGFQTHQEALKAADVLNSFVHFNFSDENIKNAMSRIHNVIRNNYYETKVKEKQTKITDFFRS